MVYPEYNEACDILDLPQPDKQMKQVHSSTKTFKKYKNVQTSTKTFHIYN